MPKKKINYKKVYENIDEFLTREIRICRTWESKCRKTHGYIEAWKFQIQANCWEFFRDNIFREDEV